MLDFYENVCGEGLFLRAWRWQVQRLWKRVPTVTSCSSGNGEWKWRERGELMDETQEGRSPAAQVLWDLTTAPGAGI